MENLLIERLFEEYGLQLTRTFCSTNTEAIKNAVIRGRGIAVLSRRMIEKERAAGEIIVLPVEGLNVTRNINFVIHKNKYLSKVWPIAPDTIVAFCTSAATLPSSGSLTGCLFLAMNLLHNSTKN